MSLSTSTSRVVFQGDAANDTFTYSFIIPTATDVIVTFTDGDGTQTILTSAQYAITGLDDPDGGTIQYPLSGTVMAVGETLTLERNVPYTQEVVLSNQGAYYPSVVEGAMDTLDMQIQQIHDMAQRSIRAAPVDSNPTMVLPAAAARADGYLAFDSSGSVAIVSASGGTVVWQSTLPTAGGTMTGPINETMDTVASHATTADIWSAGNVINWTGTATTSAFPAAPVAGTRRLLICADACKFTTGANLLVRGIVSGTTITMNDGAFVWVTALTTTQFQLEYALDGSFAAQGVGFLTTPATNTWYYTVINGAVHISPHNTIIGSAVTASGTAFTITGFPDEIVPNEAGASDVRLFMNLAAKDAGAWTTSAYATLDNTGIMTLYTSPAGGTWTSGGAVGDKILPAQELHYSL